MLSDVDCQSENFGAGSFYNVTFKQWPTMPMENNYFSHKGNPALSNFTCDVSGALSLVVMQAVMQHFRSGGDDITEYQYCGRRVSAILRLEHATALMGTRAPLALILFLCRINLKFITWCEYSRNRNRLHWRYLQAYRRQIVFI